MPRQRHVPGRGYISGDEGRKEAFDIFSARRNKLTCGACGQPRDRYHDREKCIREHLAKIDREGRQKGRKP